MVVAASFSTLSEMAKYRGIILLLVMASAGCVFGIGLNDALDIIRLGRQTVMEVLESWEMIAPRIPSDKIKSSEDLVFMKMIERELLQRMDQVSRKIDEYQEQMETKADTILTQLLVRLPMQGRLDESLRQLDHYIGQVQGLYNFFELYANNSDKYEKYTILQFAQTCVSPRLGELPDVLKSIHRLMVPFEQQVYNRSILVLLADQMQVGIWCVSTTVSKDAIEEMDGYPG